MKVYEKMTQEYFDSVLAGRQLQIEQILTVKAREYAGTGMNVDRMHNFNKSLELNPDFVTRENSIFSYWLKHYVSLRDILCGLEKDIVPTQALVSEKIGDLINYLILMEASIYQTIDKEAVDDLPF